ncbi:hypothetical protein ABVK25_005545 [Lepraria finkii]|uniref:Uncharacterized protein n=1 Tax=Lepraria finkii TaxID=1340010 RepID=A0ABR4BAD1_9LECA
MAASTPHSKPGPFLRSLPREERDKIYVQQLCVDILQQQRQLDQHRFTTGLLLVNKQINAEAFEILYLRNTWVRITMARRVHRELANRLNYQKSERKVKLNEAYFTREASLDMVVRIHNDKFTGEEYTFIVSSFGLPPICRALTADRRTCYHSVLALELDMKMPSEGTRWDRKSLLEYFVETRGPGSLKISARLAKLVKDLDEGLRQQLAATKKPLGTFDELLNGSSTYQSRGLQQLELKNAYRAHTIFQEGLGYMQWLMDCQHGHSIYPINSTIPSPLSNKCWELGKASMLCCMDLGDRNSARSITKSLFKCDHSFACRSQVTQAEAYYYLGFVHVADGAENAPANSFLHASLLKPGYGRQTKQSTR